MREFVLWVSVAVYPFLHETFVEVLREASSLKAFFLF